MLGTLLAIFIYGMIVLGFLDVLLYVAVKIKDKRRKKKEKSETNILLNENESKNVPS